jgi:hypothetical protein
MKDAIPLRGLSIRDFEASEMNCDTCVHLQRTPHAKNVGKFLYGICGKGEPSTYETKNGIMFHPDETMPHNEKCYEHRYSVKK